MDIQKLESIILTDAKAEAQILINQTKKETEKKAKEQIQQLKITHEEELEKLKSDFQSKHTSMKTSLDVNIHKNIVRLKKEKILSLKNDLSSLLFEKSKKNPDWFLKKSFSQIDIKEGQLFISDDLSLIFTQTFLENFLKEKHPGLIFSGIDPGLETGMSIVKNSVRYIFPLHESVDAFVETFADKINSLLFP